MKINLETVKNMSKKTKIICVSAFALLLCAVLIVIFFACSGERGDLLYSVELDGLTYCVRGDGTQAEQIVVKQGDELLWYENVDVAEEIGNYKESFGFFADDLNFDGHRDLSIATDVSGDCYTYSCFLFDPASGEYLPSEELSRLYNVRADAKLKAVFGFTHTDASQTANATDAATMYEWQSGILVPRMRVSLIYYRESNIYLYSVAYYNEQTKEFEEDYGKEAWMTPEEYNSADKSVVFYFK